MLGSRTLRRSDPVDDVLDVPQPRLDRSDLKRGFLLQCGEVVEFPVHRVESPVHSVQALEHLTLELIGTVQALQYLPLELILCQLTLLPFSLVAHTLSRGT